MLNKASILLKQSWELPGEKKVGKVLDSLSLTEKVLGLFLILLLSISSATLLLRANYALTVPVPAHGGTLVEGIVGSPRFANPVLALPGSNADRDLVALIYSGLLKSTPKGELIPDLAESWEVSEDGLKYTFILKDEIYFHDGKPVTTADVEFTVLKIQEPSLRSPRRANWEGVKTEVKDSKTISFILSQPYAMFLDNATLGILPKHLWNNLSQEQFSFSLLNIEPVGSGPYKIKSLKKDSNGLPISYHLTSFRNYTLGEPFLKNVILRFYTNENELIEAFERGVVESVSSISPEKASDLIEKGALVKTNVLPRIFGVFLNQNESSIFTQKEVRRALDMSLDKERIVEEVLLGFGRSINSPVPIAHLPQPEQGKDISLDSSRIEKAIEILESGGWKLGEGESVRTRKTKDGNSELRFSISTGNLPDLKAVATILQEEWRKIGAEVDIKFFEANGDLSQNVIRPRNYESLLFGISAARDLDLFPFWHSSQRNDPGFNIGLYANITTDKLLEEARVILNKDERMEKYIQFEKEVLEDSPAIFIYSPDFIYVLPRKLKEVDLGLISQSSDRFLNVHNWYIETDKIWKIFVKQK